MSTLDNALQALFSMAHKELLWKNASPASSFAEQNLSVNTTGIDDCIRTITYGQTGSRVTLNTALIPQAIYGIKL